MRNKGSDVHGIARIHDGDLLFPVSPSIIEIYRAHKIGELVHEVAVIPFCGRIVRVIIVYHAQFLNPLRPEWGHTAPVRTAGRVAALGAAAAPPGAV